MRIEYHRATADDLNNAISFYEAERPGLGYELRDEVYRAIDRVVESPLRYPKVSGEIRRCLVHRFPLSILFRALSNNVVRILVIRHHRRHQSFGMRRR
jgi:plasmid stabilization system protein ParE